ncbi:MAG: NAD-dependent epimerase/dehydratase family protein [Phycisphaeraceae bacterium]
MTDSPHTALVTGATGFTGGHLARELARQGTRVRTIARDPAAAEPLRRQGIEIIEGDLRDPRAVRQAAEGCDEIYHIAALYRSAKHPDSVYRDVNVGGTRNVLDAAADAGARRVVHCSTVGVHGDIRRIPAGEDAPFSPGDIYQQTKLEAEQLVRERTRAGLPATIFRPVGIYGPGDTRFLKLFTMIHTGRFRMFGPGQALYHLTWIDDLVDGIIRCGRRDEALGQTYILAGPRYTTISELAALVARAVGQPAPRGRLPMWPLEAAAVACEGLCRPLGIEPPLHRRRLDFFLKDRAFTSEKACRELGYAPKVDPAEGLARTARWYFDEGYLRGPVPDDAAAARAPSAA